MVCVFEAKGSSIQGLAFEQWGLPDREDKAAHFKLLCLSPLVSAGSSLLWTIGYGRESLAVDLRMVGGFSARLGCFLHQK